ncbi:MAG: CotH kinase family protein, partial [Prevotellaceae bacterium]|nr:CotH kinase family protein [Prevotellaceae bacterium]
HNHKELKTQNILLAIFALLCIPFSGFAAAGWIDVTDVYIKNARYDNNSGDYWSGTTLGFVNPKNNAEHYQKDFDTYQDLRNLPSGKYRLSLKGYYRAGDSNSDYSHFMYDGDKYRYAKLYASSSISIYSTPLVYSYSGASSRNYGGGVVQVNGKYVPNNMEAAYYWFEAGYYDNSVELNVGNDGYLRIGISKNTTLSGDWTCIDSWKLEYWGEQVKVEKITFDKSSLELVVGEQYKLNVTISPDNATNQSLNWQVGDNSILNVDENGVVTALKTGSTSVRATANDGSGCYAMCTVKVTVNTPTTDNIIINEIQTSNIDMYLDPSWNYGPWIELYNPTSKGVSLNGLYITDDAENLKKYKFTTSHGVVPANGYKAIWFDHYDLYALSQVNFKPDYEGGTIIISDGTNILSQVSYPEIAPRTSYARTVDGGTKWGKTANPTLESSNAASIFATKQLDAPVIDKGGQLFTGSLTFNVTIPDGTTLVYTTDGTTPTETNGTKTTKGEFTVSSSTAYRFRLYRDGYLPSRVVTRSFIYKDREYVFPIMSVVTNPDNIYSKEFGVFEQGPNGRPGNGQTTKCNWNMDWDRPVNMEYIVQDDNGSYSVMAHNQEANFATCGGWSRAWTPHSFKLKADKQYYGENFLSYPYFKEKPFIKNKTLQIRNGGNDNGCRIKDAALQEIVRRSGFYVDGQCWQPIHVFINGSYYDVLNMREPNNKHFAYSNYGIDTDNMDQFEISPDSGYVQMEGTEEAMTEWYNLSKTASTSASYDRICQLVDIDEYANYMAVEFYYGCSDWPQNNFKGFRDRSDGKFHFVLFDLDGAFGTGSDPFNKFAGKKNYTFDVLHGDGIEGVRRSAEIKLVTIFLNMLNNSTFRKKFIDSYCILGASVCDADRVKEIVTEMRDYEGKNGFVNPSSTANSIISTINANYNNTMTNALKNYSAFKLTSTAKQKLTLTSNLADAKLYLNNNIIPTGKFNGYFFAPAVLKAEAPAGYKFAGWTNGGTTKSTNLIARDAVWKYYDKGSLDGKSWKSASFDDSKWSSGKAPLGYAKSDLNTTLGYGGNSNSKYPTYYFRH